MAAWTTNLGLGFGIDVCEVVIKALGNDPNCGEESATKVENEKRRHSAIECETEERHGSLSVPFVLRGMEEEALENDEYMHFEISLSRLPSDAIILESFPESETLNSVAICASLVSTKAVKYINYLHRHRSVPRLHPGP